MSASVSPLAAGHDELPLGTPENAGGAVQELPTPGPKASGRDGVVEIADATKGCGGDSEEWAGSSWPVGILETRSDKCATEERDPKLGSAATGALTAETGEAFERWWGSLCLSDSSFPSRVYIPCSHGSLSPSVSSHSSPGVVPQPSPGLLAEALPVDDVSLGDRGPCCSFPTLPGPAGAPSLSFVSSLSCSSSHSSSPDTEGCISQSGGCRNADTAEPHGLDCSAGETNCGRSALSAPGAFSLSFPLSTAEIASAPSPNAELWLPALPEAPGVHTLGVQSSLSVRSWEDTVGPRGAEGVGVLQTTLCSREPGEERASTSVGRQATVPDLVAPLFYQETKGQSGEQARVKKRTAASPSPELRQPPSVHLGESLWEGLFGGEAREASFWLVKHLLWAERTEQLEAELNGMFRSSSPEHHRNGPSPCPFLFSCFPLWKNIAARRRTDEGRESSLLSPALSALFAVNSRTLTSMLMLPSLAAWDEKVFFSAFTSPEAQSRMIPSWSSFFYGDAEGSEQDSRSLCLSCRPFSPPPFLGGVVIGRPVIGSLCYISHALLNRCEHISTCCKHHLVGFQRSNEGRHRNSRNFSKVLRLCREVFCRLLLLHSTAVAVAWGRHIHFDWRTASDAPTPRHKQLSLLPLLCLELCRQQGEIRKLQGSISHKLRQQHEAATRSRLLDVLWAAAAGDESSTANSDEVFPFLFRARGPPVEGQQHEKQERGEMNEAKIADLEEDASEMQTVLWWLAAHVFMCDSQVYLHLPADQPVSHGAVPVTQEIPATKTGLQDLRLLEQTCSAAVSVHDDFCICQDGVTTGSPRCTRFCCAWARRRAVHSDGQVAGNEAGRLQLNSSTLAVSRRPHHCNREVAGASRLCPCRRDVYQSAGDRTDTVPLIVSSPSSGCMLDVRGQHRSPVRAIRVAILLLRTTFRHFLCSRSAVPTQSDASAQMVREFPTPSLQSPVCPHIVDVIMFSWFGTGRRPSPSPQGNSCPLWPVSPSTSPPSSPSSPISCDVTAPQQRFTLLFLAADGRLLASGDIPPFLVRTSPLCATLTKGRLGSFFHAHPVEAVCSRTGRPLLFSAFLAANPEGAAVTSGLALPRYRHLQGSVSGDMLISRIPTSCSSEACSAFGPSPSGVPSSSGPRRSQANANATGATADTAANEPVSPGLEGPGAPVQLSDMRSLALLRGRAALHSFEHQPVGASSGGGSSGCGSARFWSRLSPCDSFQSTEDRDNSRLGRREETLPCVLAILQSHTGDPVRLQMAFEKPNRSGTQLQRTAGCRSALIQGIGGIREDCHVALEFVSWGLVGRGRYQQTPSAATSFKNEVDTETKGGEGTHRNKDAEHRCHATQRKMRSTRGEGGGVKYNPVEDMPCFSSLPHLLESQRWAACCVYHLVVLVKTGPATHEGNILLSTLEKTQHDWLTSFFVSHPHIRASIRSLRLGFEHLTAFQNDRVRQKLFMPQPKAGASPERQGGTGKMSDTGGTLRRGRWRRRGNDSFVNGRKEVPEDQVTRQTVETTCSTAERKKPDKTDDCQPGGLKIQEAGMPLESNGDVNRGIRDGSKRIRPLLEWEEADGQLRLFLRLVDGAFLSINLHQRRVEIVWDSKDRGLLEQFEHMTSPKDRWRPTRSSAAHWTIFAAREFSDKSPC
ncbi:conserved hypothetical protein [Neospora caninum Liverpool]|uniref:Uncharacterized protein n=1 Tax=Neospora caninum (strain Liverpool) TaxID=572307 RepID=F0V7D7_NEOCL|nr:conserved hypothetical protein [Neospora caninum Liverpool]CBZ49628.1 conserved hypothetical protein [Neospora caninum Liverpool]|eukprot:XP_003879663.1 conserved hypothetical protein [Neospora caninum Liverpool]